MGLEWTRQTIGDVGNGKRDVKAFELSKIAQVLHCEISFFLKTENSAPQAYILWRDRQEEYLKMEAFFLKKCRDFNLVEKLNKISDSDFRKLPQVQFDILKASYDQAYDLAEAVRTELNLGDYPASTLKKILEKRFGVKFLFEDLEGKGSAASSKSDLGSCIIVNSSEPSWRQNFSIAHELFHIVTWDESLFKHIQSDKDFWLKNEKIAKAFAAGLLIPSENLKRDLKLVVRDGILQTPELIALSRQYEVSISAIIWRLVNTKLLSEKDAAQAFCDKELLGLNRKTQFKVKKDYLISHRFIRLAYLAYSKGDISRSRLSSMLTIPLGDLSMVLERFGFEEIEDHEISFSHS